MLRFLLFLTWVSGSLLLPMNHFQITFDRKKGFATAMLNHLLERAKKKGCLIATLQASQEGLLLYERLGFKGCCQFLAYS